MDIGSSLIEAYRRTSKIHCKNPIWHIFKNITFDPRYNDHMQSQDDLWINEVNAFQIISRFFFTVERALTKDVSQTMRVPSILLSLEQN